MAHNIQPEQQLMVCLRFLASGAMQNVSGDAVGLHQPSVSTILPRVCDDR